MCIPTWDRWENSIAHSWHVFKMHTVDADDDCEDYDERMDDSSESDRDGWSDKGEEVSASHQQNLILLSGCHAAYTSSEILYLVFEY